MKRNNQSIPLWEIIKSQRNIAKEEERNKRITQEPENNQKLTIINSKLSIITLNVDELNSSIQRHKVDYWITTTTTTKNNLLSMRDLFQL